MMKHLGLAAMFKAIPLTLALAVGSAPTNELAAATRGSIGFLEGTFIVRCPRGHDDQVEDITRNHDCSHGDCGLRSVDDGRATVLCPDGHANHVEGITRQHKCTFPLPSGGECAKQCRR